MAYSRYAKLEAAFDCDTHLLLGPRRPRAARDTDRFVPLLEATLEHVGLDAALADAGYDSEANHLHARETCGVRSFIPATIGRPTVKLPTGRYRRRSEQRLTKDYGGYGQRLAGRNRLLDAQTPPGHGSERPELLEPVP